MNRIIKFRAWEIPLKFMRDWEDIRDVMNMGNFDNDEFIFMQFTGLTDKNGKECYEADIVKPVNGMEKEYGIVIWSEEKAGFDIDWRYAKNLGKYDYRVESLSGLEVIGNIYENKDLIK